MVDLRVELGRKLVCLVAPVGLGPSGVDEPGAQDGIGVVRVRGGGPDIEGGNVKDVELPQTQRVGAILSPVHQGVARPFVRDSVEPPTGDQERTAGLYLACRLFGGGFACGDREVLLHFAVVEQRLHAKSRNVRAERGAAGRVLGVKRWNRSNGP